MSTEQRVSRLDRIKDEGIERLWSRWWWRLWVAVAVVALGVMFSMALIDPSLAGSESVADVGADVSSMGVSDAAIGRDPSFDFLDHELRYAGGYILRPVARTPGDCACPLLENELELTRGDGLLPAAAATLASAGAFDPVRYVPLVIRNVLEGLSRSAGLTIADASDPLQVTSLEAEEAAARARSEAAWAARYQGMADLFTAEGKESIVSSAGLSMADASDPLQATSLKAKEAADLARSEAAWAARYQGMADLFAAEGKGSIVSSAGLTMDDASDPLQVASLEAKEAADRARSMAAYAARYQGLADALEVGREICGCVTP